MGLSKNKSYKLNNYNGIWSTSTAYKNFINSYVLMVLKRNYWTENFILVSDNFIKKSEF